jgi:hypothetical protein
MNIISATVSDCFLEKNTGKRMYSDARKINECVRLEHIEWI